MTTDTKIQDYKVKDMSLASFGHKEISTSILLIFSGIITGLPLLLFSAAVRRIPLISIGVLQYMAPSLQFLLGVFIYKEVLNKTQLIGFIIVWIALIIYTVESIFRRNMMKQKCNPGIIKYKS